MWNCFTPDARFALQWWLVEAESHATAPDPAEVAAVRWCTVEEILQLTPTFHDDIRFFVEIWPTLSTLEHHPDDR